MTRIGSGDEVRSWDALLHHKHNTIQAAIRVYTPNNLHPLQSAEYALSPCTDLFAIQGWAHSIDGPYWAISAQYFSRETTSSIAFNPLSVTEIGFVLRLCFSHKSFFTLGQKLHTCFRYPVRKSSQSKHGPNLSLSLSLSCASKFPTVSEPSAIDSYHLSKLSHAEFLTWHIHFIAMLSNTELPPSSIEPNGWRKSLSAYVDTCDSETAEDYIRLSAISNHHLRGLLQR